MVITPEMVVLMVLGAVIGWVFVSLAGRKKNGNGKR